MFEGIILKCDIRASMLCLSGLIFFKPIRHIVWNEEDSLTASDECTLPRNSMSHSRDEVCLFFLEQSSLALMWFLETCMNNKCYFDQLLSRRRTSPASLRSGRKWGLSGGAGTHVSVIRTFLLGFAATRHHFICIKSLRVFQPALCCLEMYQLLDRALASYLYFFSFFFFSKDI